MSNPIVAFQSELIAALTNDGALTALVGADAVFDAPPKGKRPPYVTVSRHDLAPRDGDAAPGWEHRVVLHAWAAEASRKAVLAIADRVLTVALNAALDGELVVTHRRHVRTETVIDRGTGFARAAVELRFFTEAAG
jgi:hypothetical protein